MPRDTLESTSALTGSPFTGDITVPIGDIGGGIVVGSNDGITAIGGDMIIFDGVPHVAWCELEGPIGYEDAIGAHTASVWRGPYIARWSGSDWELVTPTPALPEAWDNGETPGSPKAADGHGPGWRRAPKLATDGTHLYCGVPGALTSDPLTPPGNPFDIHSYFTHFSIYAFRLDGESWTTLGADGSSDMFPSSITGNGEFYDGGPGQGTDTDFSWDISASPDAPGQCYFAISDQGASNSSLSHGVESYSHLVVAGTDMAETVLEDFASSSLSVEGGLISPADVSLAGGGQTLTLYYRPGGVALAAAYVPDKVLVWTPALGTGEEIDAVSFGIPYISVDLALAPAASEDGGIRYLVFGGTFNFGGGNTPWLDVIQTGDPFGAPADLQHLSTSALSRYSSDGSTIDLDVALLRGGPFGFTPFPLIVEARNYWLGLNDGSGSPSVGVRWVAQLDRQCRAPSVGWTLYKLPASDFSSGRMVVYEDALWWFATNDGATGSSPRPQVWRTPICRGCVDCPRNGLHVWRRI